MKKSINLCSACVTRIVAILFYRVSVYTSVQHRLPIFVVCCHQAPICKTSIQLILPCHAFNTASFCLRLVPYLALSVGYLIIMSKSINIAKEIFLFRVEWLPVTIPFHVTYSLPDKCKISTMTKKKVGGKMYTFSFSIVTFSISSLRLCSISVIYVHRCQVSLWNCTSF